MKFHFITRMDEAIELALEKKDAHSPEDKKRKKSKREIRQAQLN